MTDDIISRKMAIDAVAELASSMSVCISVDECHGMKRMQGMAVRALDDLPSAQPQQWISRSERLPEPDERVLVYTVGKEFHVWDAMPHRGENYAWEDEEGLYHSLHEVDLWMPLPEPFK